MKISDIPVPEVYKESADFRFFMKWFEMCLSKIKYDTDHFTDLLDPERCPADLLWLLGDTMGYKYDSRLCAAFNRLVMIYFMSMIRNKGSKTGVTLAAEVNLAQFSINNYGKEKDILYNRLEDTSIPVNSVYVTPHTKEGYIDVVYFSTEKPVDACIEYVRPLGMYMFDHAGVRLDARTKISIDARLTNTREAGVSLGSTHVGHYRRSDYASLQQAELIETEYYDAFKDKSYAVDNQVPDANAARNNVWYRNSDAEVEPNKSIDAGWRTLYSLQLANNEHIVESLIPTEKKLFSVGYQPEDVTVHIPDNYLDPEYLQSPEYKKSNDYLRAYNLRYDASHEEPVTQGVHTLDPNRQSSIMNPKPAVNPAMHNLGDAIALYTLPQGKAADDVNLDSVTHADKFSQGDASSELKIVDVDGNLL